MSKEGNGTEEALADSEQELRLLVEAIPALVWRAGPEGNIEYVNKRVLDYLGAPLSDVMGWGWMDKVHPDDVAFKSRTWLQNLGSGDPHDAVCRFRGADGRYRGFEVRGEPLRARGGRVLSWCGVLIDIDDRRNAEEALREGEYELRQIVETVTGLIWSTGPEERPRFLTQLQAILNVIPAYTWYAAPSGALTFVNKRTADYLGLPKDHPLRFGIDIGAQWDDWVQLLHPDDHEGSRKVWSTCLRTGEAGEYSFRVRNVQGGYRWFLSRSEPLRASDGTLLQWVGVNLDIEELKCAEQALRESEYKLRQIIETVPSLLWSVGPLGEQTHLNQRALDYIGVRYEDLLRLGWTAFLHPDDLSETANAFSHSMQTGTSFQAVHRLRRADGEYFWHHARGEPLRDGRGRVIQWYGLTVDIDEGKRAEDRLRRSEAYLAEAQRLSHTGSFGWTPSSGELHWSDETFRILEYDPSIKPTIERVLQRIHPDDRAMIRQLIDEISSGEKDFDVAHRLLMPDGSVKFVHVLSHALKDAAGNLEIVGALMDVTENTCLYRDLAEREARLAERTAALRRSEANLAEAQGLSHTGSAAYNDTTLLYWSDETYRILGFDPRKGLPPREAVVERTHPDDRDRVREQTRRALQQKRDFKLEYRILPLAGTIKHIEMNAHPKFSEGGELVEVVSTLIDVTERKRAHEEHERLRQLESDLAHMNRLSMMGELAASLAHEITQPIAAGRNNARAALNFLDQQPPDLGEVREALGCVVGDADRAGQIVDRIRDHIKKAPPRKHRFDLNEAINEVIVLARSAIAEKGVSVQTRLREGPAPVEGDRVQVQQVLLNLVLNAAEAISAVDEGARELLISTEQGEANGVLVAVRDSGPGIDPEVIERVFDAFYTTKSGGMGMGLSICRSIIAAHGGRLWADANEPKGAAFQFTLPGSERSS
jgi:PAS domain S-box-containing protein